MPPMTSYGFGWQPRPPDSRDWSALKLAAMIERGAAVPIAWDCPVTLSQAGTQHCVGFAGAAFWAAAQYNAPGNADVTDVDGHALYYDAQAQAGVKPEDPTYEQGSHLRALMKALKARGIIDAYAFASTFEESQDWLQRYGAVVWGTYWYENMMRPNSAGLVQVSGAVRGGHAWLQVADKQNPADNGIHNSWGDWGLAPKSVQAYITDADLYRLYDAQGEAAMAVKLTGPVPHWPDLPDMDADDLQSQHEAWSRGVFKGFADGTFRPGPKDGQPDADPYGKVTRHQLGAVGERLGLFVSPWNKRSDWTTYATRGLAHEWLPALKFNEDRWEEPLNRYQLLLLCGRYLRGV